MFFLLFLFTIILLAPVSRSSQCQPPNDCSVHVFRVRLSQKPEDDPQNQTYQNNNNNNNNAYEKGDYGNNYYEIRGGKEMTPKLAAEIISSMGENADPRLKEKINNKEFFWKAVSPNERVAPSVPVPPPPPPPKKVITTTESSYSFRPSDFPVLLVSLLICVGIFLGIMLTAICLFMANMQKEPQFDRSSVVIYNKVGGGSRDGSHRPMLSTRREQQIELIENASVAPSMSSATRIGPAWRNGNNPPQPSIASRHISL